MRKIEDKFKFFCGCSVVAAGNEKCLSERAGASSRCRIRHISLNVFKSCEKVHDSTQSTKKIPR